MSPRFHTLKIKDVNRETADAVSISFDVPDDLKNDYSFSAGQYLTLKTLIDGREVRRSYSICAGEQDGELRVAIKRIDGGQFSTFANENLEPGTEIEVMSPSGRFLLPDTDGSPRTLVAIAAGSGITPILAMIRTVLACEPETHFFLFYGNRSSQSIIFKNELEDLKDLFPTQLSVFHVLSREEQDLPLLSGRLDREKLETLLRHMVPAEGVDHFFLCGPGELIETAKGALKALGVDEGRIHQEFFTPADGSAPHAPKPAHEGAAVDHKAMAELVMDGARVSVPIAAGETIIDAAVRAGVEAPYSCKGGMCCTCRAKLVEGKVDMAVNYSLEPWEVEAGFVLTCQSRPISERVVLDYDEI
ncbi:phenylacetate-CoA oxygenase/reductase subunit PaaK [Rhizobiales bacterium]|uniref:1,2-phenylacetyl-CoA epoxidase subunit PaaE n=1 Tax=Hongsoonwoonella zoysiae TaxID=2821844 RepID=UPI00155F6BCF|nr:1,2-phenylacetyl-CoA epoxidase subunit PaaE [Hongsoonwoonella zoysiae]NRG19027.1 phenylacetate-CoA oxygenase/reductase subunit PaaK [Hongsoonwoonella zoysiae]